jgi:uncharacterized protein (DUF1684 family)
MTDSRLAQEMSAHRDWHQARLQALCAPDGWLTLIDLIWLDEGKHSVGSDPASQIQLPHVPLQWGALEIMANKAVWQASGESPVALETDRNGVPTIIRTGRISFFLIERDEGLGLRVRDEQAATRTEFSGIDCFAFDPDFQISANWNGEAAEFDYSGHRYRLHPQNPAAPTLQFVIADSTSGQETYGGGRFLFVPHPTSNALILDFNRAINPPCSFTPFAVCPLPPAENRLPFAVRAGEKTCR